MLNGTKSEAVGIEEYSRRLLRQATLPVGSAQPAPCGMLVFAHPDDEVIAMGARLARYRSSVIVHVTDGAPRANWESHSHGFPRREDYAASRESELQRALASAGLAQVRRISLQVPDQEASLNLVYLVRELRHLLAAHTPEVIFTHPYEGGHPDHDACAFAVERAIAMARTTKSRPPTPIEAAFYHLGPQGIQTGCFLPRPGSPEELLWPLSPEEQQRKKDLLACFVTQTEMLRNFLYPYERFRIAAEYSFSEPPHGGRVLYENYAWGMTARRFCNLVCAADRTLGTCL